MSGLGWLIVSAIGAHFVLCGVVLRLSRKSGLFSPRQQFAQLAVALLVPVVGPLLVVLLARERSPAAPQYDASRFDRDELPPHG